jgi:tocopherol O-methyltransferase
MNGMAQTKERKNEPHPGDNHDIPAYEAHASSITLKERIRHHYELASDYYYSLW